MSSTDKKQKNHPILDRYKMRDTVGDMKKVLMGQGEFTVSYGLALVVGQGMFLAAIIFFIFRAIINPFSVLTLLALFTLIGYLVIFFIVGIITQEKEGYYSRTVIGIVFILMQPAIWFYSGGYSGAGPVWFVFCAVYLCAGLTIKQFLRVIPLYIVTLIGTIFVSLKYPEIIKSEEAHISKMNTIATICISALFLSLVILLQRYISEMDRKKIAELQSDLSDSNEELAASNEELTASNEELIASNEELMEVTDKLQEAMDKQKMFSASMTHELRSPLNGIEGSLQMMLMSGTLDEDNRLSVENALNACRNITRNVNDMLDFAKLSEGKFEIVSREFDLRTVIKNVRYLFEEQVRAKGLEFVINAPAVMKCSLLGDDVRISQILTNLISNSVKYTKEGSVVCDFDVKDNNLYFTVKDTGIGMSKESIEVLFDPFTRFDLKVNSGIQGTGLGMNIVYNLIKAMNGEINVHSELGKGTTFEVYIPVTINDESVVYADEFSVQKETKFITADFSNVNILCVDDTKINLIVFNGLLKDTNAKVDTAEGYNEAMEVVATKKYDLIFVDHFMPNKDGIEFYRDLRNGDGINKATPVVMLTGNTSDDYTKLYQNEGFDGWLTKPIAQNELVESIKRLLSLD